MSDHSHARTFSLWFWRIIFTIFILFSSLWLCLALWIQQPFSQTLSVIFIGLWLIFAGTSYTLYLRPIHFSRLGYVIIYLIGFSLGLTWYFNIPPRQDRVWNAEVAKMLDYERHGDDITLHNVRHFQWSTEKDFKPNWQSRKIQLQDIQAVNIIASYWMGPKIAHTLVSFDIRDQAPLVFSIEIRKEEKEDFSAIGGFFRQFELSLIAADEQDIVYTRSNIRGEQVYFFPTTMSPEMAQALFLEYLDKAKQLQQKPQWYNTLTSNCTTLVFDMMQVVTHRQLPLDYRLIASGYLPNYLYDLGALPHAKWDMQTWYRHAHVNPKTLQKTQISSSEYSKLIRKGLVESNLYANP